MGIKHEAKEEFGKIKNLAKNKSKYCNQFGFKLAARRQFQMISSVIQRLSPDQDRSISVIRSEIRVHKERTPDQLRDIDLYANWLERCARLIGEEL